VYLGKLVAERRFSKLLFGCSKKEPLLALAIWFGLAKTVGIGDRVIFCPKGLFYERITYNTMIFATEVPTGWLVLCGAIVEQRKPEGPEMTL
jgi:hypothetical protein